MYPAVLDEFETVSQILQGKSIARYGDGELNLCLGIRAKAQVFSPKLSKRLQAILKSDSDCLVGIPRIADYSFMSEQKKQFWSKYTDPKFTALYEPHKQYASAFITRPDSVPAINNTSYFEALKSVWASRNVVLIGGDKPGQRFDEDSSILQGSESVKRWLAPNENAWDGYKSQLQKCQTQSKDTLFILSIGPTATVLAYDLNNTGYQALDLGHLGMFYARLNG